HTKNEGAKKTKARKKRRHRVSVALETRCRIRLTRVSGAQKLKPAHRGRFLPTRRWDPFTSNKHLLVLVGLVYGLSIAPKERLDHSPQADQQRRKLAHRSHHRRLDFDRRVFDPPLSPQQKPVDFGHLSLKSRVCQVERLRQLLSLTPRQTYDLLRRG